MTDTPTAATRVCFRKEDNAVLAVFPDEHDFMFRYACYSHVGQHSHAVRDYILGHTRPATPDEYRDLKAELEGETYGYRLEVLTSWPKGV